MNDLFTPATDAATDAAQYRLHDLMKKQWEADLLHLQINGIIAPWWESDTILERDEESVLNYIADNAPCPYTDEHFADVLGYKAEGNLKASVIKCRERGLIEFKTIDNVVHVCLSAKGSYILDSMEYEYE